MLRTTLPPTVYLALGVTDLRNNIDGLALIVQRRFKLDPFDKSLFVFCNRKKDKLKILYWDKNGFWLYYKRLEEDKKPCVDVIIPIYGDAETTKICVQAAKKAVEKYSNARLILINDCSPYPAISSPYVDF